MFVKEAFCHRVATIRLTYVQKDVFPSLLPRSRRGISWGKAVLSAQTKWNARESNLYTNDLIKSPTVTGIDARGCRHVVTTRVRDVGANSNCASRYLQLCFSQHVPKGEESSHLIRLAFEKTVGFYGLWPQAQPWH